MMEVPRELHAFDVTPLRVFTFLIHVAADGIRHQRLDAFDEVLVVDRAVDPVLAERHERDDVQLPLHGGAQAADGAALPAGDEDRVGAGRHRRLQEPVRVEPDIELADFRGLRRGSRHPVGAHVPRDLVHDELRLPLLAVDGNATAATRGIVTLPGHALLLRGPRVVVDRPGVVGQFHPGPVVPDVVVLTHDSDVTGPGVGHAFQIVRAHGLGGGLEHGLRGLRGLRLGRHRRGHHRQ